MSSKYGKYTILDDMVLIEVTPEILDLEEQKLLDRAKAAGLTLSKDNSLDKEKARKTVGTMTGKLVAKGSRAFEDIETDIPEVGNTVLFKRYAGMELDKTEDAAVFFKIMLSSELIAIINNTKEEV